MKRPLATAAALVLLAGPVPAEDEIDKANLAFNNHCRTCHSRDEGDNRLGPNLHEIVGREAGGAKNYAYSSAFEQADFAWDEAKLDAYIANPDEVVPGNKMQPFSGIQEADIRAQIIEGLGGDPSKI